MTGSTQPFPVPLARGEDVHTEVGALRIGSGAFAVLPTELDPQIGPTYRKALADATGAEHTFIVGLGNDQLGYQVPEAKFDPSCFECAAFIFRGIPEMCPQYPPDCGAVFQNTVGRKVDRAITEALLEAIDGL